MQSSSSILLSANVPATQFYTWQGYRCAYEVLTPPDPSTATSPPLLLIHPIGVGLSRHFWRRFGNEWYGPGRRNRIYNPDLLGCGDSDKPAVAYYPIDWARQLQYFLQTVVKTPVVVMVQGALLPVAIELVQLQPDLIRGLVFSGPPAWALITRTTAERPQRLRWNLFASWLGVPFYRYARRAEFLRSFSTRQLFATAEDVDAEWITTLQQGAQDLASRYAVFSFLSGFWRQDYREKLAAIAQPVLVVMGEQSSSISREGKRETPDQRLADYLACLPKAQSVKMPGRNVLSYEQPIAFVQAIAPFIEQLPG